MATITSLTTKRWDGGNGKPSSHSPREALEVALSKIDASEIEADHIIVIYGTLSHEDVIRDGFFQAGKLDSYAQIGLLHRAMKLMMDGA